MLKAFRKNKDFLNEIKREPGYSPTLVGTAQQIVRGAQVASPDQTGHYDRSLHVVQDNGQVFAATDDIAGHIIEFGSVKTPPHAPLRRGAMSVGLRFVDDAK